MANRWQMNRMGFINFWLYDEEIFQFNNGRLLLRGANASGKSITTQSIIPFILDGDRSPSRLDPFGSGDRKMEYYFLGNGERDDVTGYLFLEFKKQGLEQYRTIGIGQRAQKGKPMDFWGFIILDNQRIGVDLQLYKEVGDKKIPHTRQILKNLLGDSNPVVTRQHEYMELINKYLFAFPRLEQYEQFIQLMLKVRAPKLSRDFKPSKIYEVLNESLQTLSDADLRPMVEAMEKMDSIQAQLDGLKGAFKALQAVKREYDRYNTYVWAEKGNCLIRCHGQVTALEKNLSTERANLLAYKDETNRRIQRNENIRLETESLQREKSLLPMEDIQESLDQLQRLRIQQQGLLVEMKDIASRVAECDGSIKKCAKAIDEKENQRDQQGREMKVLLEDLDTLDQVVQFDRHRDLRETTDAILSLLPEQEQLQPVLIDEAENALRQLAQHAREALSALAEDERRAAELSRQEEALERLGRKRACEQEQLEKAQRLEDECRDQLIEAYSALPEHLTELPFTTDDVKKISEIIAAYKGPQDYETARRILSDCRDWRKDELSHSQAEGQAQLRTITEKVHTVERELQELRQTTEALPPRPPAVDQARSRLMEAGIAFLPFYEAVEFAPSLAPAQQSLLENQLADAGLLDALIVAPKDQQRARQLLCDLSDRLIDTAVPQAQKPIQGLVPAEEEGPFAAVTAQVLARISAQWDGGAVLALCDDGYFRHGVLHGHSLSGASAVYLGRKARQAELQRLISAKEEERQSLLENQAACQKNLRELADAARTLQEEYKNLPAFGDLDEALALVNEAALIYKKSGDALNEKAQEVQHCRDSKLEQDRQVQSCCKLLPYRRTKAAYEEAVAAMGKYEFAFQGWSRKYRGWYQLGTEIAGQVQLQRAHEKGKADAYDQLKRERQRETLIKNDIEKLEAMTNSPERLEKKRRYEEISRLLRQLDQEGRTNENKLAQLEIQSQTSQAKVTELEAQMTDARQKRAVAQHYFEEDLRALSPQEYAVAENSNLKELMAVAQKAVAARPEALERRTMSEMVTALLRVHQQNSGLLTDYGTEPEYYFDDDTSGFGFVRKRFRIASVWQGQKLYLHGFYQVLSAAIDSTELLIQQRDRELFENILADTLSRKLSNRIAESKKWIADMSQLMLHMDTSMGLNFSLAWKARQPEDAEALDVPELEKLLSRDAKLLTQEDMDKVARHFRSSIRRAKEEAGENETTVNYADLVRQALDYRSWYEFKLSLHRPDEPKRELTNSAFNKFSGGEKAMAMYVPLFAAVNAQYRKSDSQDHPRIMALDEAFAGVDERNISSMFDLVKQLDFDYIMNSQSLWGCYATVDRLRISVLLRPANSDVVTVVNYDWNGSERRLV